MVKRRRLASTTARGYGFEHVKLRRRWAVRVATGAVACSRCGRLISASAAWHLDHRDDRNGYLGPAHRRCNLVAAARKTNRIRRARSAGRKSVEAGRRQSEAWL